MDSRLRGNDGGNKEVRMKGDLFKGVVQWEMQDAKGFAGKLPVFYYDNTSMTVIYTASTKAVRKYLPHPDMHPVEFVPGRCLVGFSAFEYRKTDIDPYNEFSISILISFGSRPIPGMTVMAGMARKCFSAYVWHLPVTTERARYGGVELYGYPKFIADIVFKRDGDHLECTLSEKGTKILTVRGRHRKTSQGGLLRFRTYSLKDGVPLCANIYTNPIEFSQSMSGDAARLDIGVDHPIGRELAGIGLGKKPIMFQYSPLNEMILFAPRNLIDD